MAIRDMRYENWKAYLKASGQTDKDLVVPRDNYIICPKKTDSLMQRLKDIPERMNIYICASEQDTFLREIVKENPDRYQLLTPNPDCFQSDLAISNAADEAVMRESQSMAMDMEAGMEL